MSFSCTYPSFYFIYNTSVRTKKMFYLLEDTRHLRLVPYLERDYWAYANILIVFSLGFIKKKCGFCTEFRWNWALFSNAFLSLFHHFNEILWKIYKSLVELTYRDDLPITLCSIHGPCSWRFTVLVTEDL